MCGGPQVLTWLRASKTVNPPLYRTIDRYLLIYIRYVPSQFAISDAATVMFLRKMWSYKKVETKWQGVLYWEVTFIYVLLLEAMFNGAVCASQAYFAGISKTPLVLRVPLNY